MQTAKTIQLRDSSNMFVSPNTNIESLYYETKSDDGSIYRNTLYQNNPLYFNQDNHTKYEKPVIGKTTDLSCFFDISDNLYSTLVQRVSGQDEDIILTRFFQRRISNTNYYALDVSNYNFTEIMKSYVGLCYVENRIIDASTYISTSIGNISNYIYDKKTEFDNHLINISTLVNISSYLSINDDSVRLEHIRQKVVLYDSSLYTYGVLSQLLNRCELINGMTYGLVYNDEAANMTISHPFIIYLRAIDEHTLQRRSVFCMKMPTSLYNADYEKWIVDYDFVYKSITYMKDEFDNEASFDFKNMKYNNHYLFNISTNNSNQDHSLSGNCYDNEILSPSCFLSIQDSKGFICHNTIGYDNSIGISYELMLTKTTGQTENIQPFSIICNSIGNGNTMLLEFDDDDFKGNYIGNYNTNIQIKNTNINVPNYICSNNTIGNNNISLGIRQRQNIIGNDNDNVLSEGIGNIIGNDNVSISITMKSGLNDASFPIYNVIGSSCNNVTIKADAQNNIVNNGCNDIDITDYNNCFVMEGNNNLTLFSDDTLYCNQQLTTTGYVIR